MKPTLLWIPPSAHAAMWKNPPELLISALQPRQLMEWRKLNRWADPIDMVAFTDDDPPRNGPPHTAFAPQTGKAPHVVVNPPLGTIARLRQLSERPTATDVDAARAYNDAASIVGAALRAYRCAWIQPESDHAFGALALTSARGGFVCAYSQRPQIDSIGVMAAGRLGVDVKTLGTIKTTAVWE